MSKKDVPPWPDVPKLQKDVSLSNVPRPQPKPRLSLKKASKVHTSPDATSQNDSPVYSTASRDVDCGNKCNPTLSDSDLGVSDEVDTCIPSPEASINLNDVTTHSSKVREVLAHVKSALSHAYTVLYEHSFQHDIKLHPPDKSHLNSPPLSVTSALLKGSFDEVAHVQHGNSPHNLSPMLYTGNKENISVTQVTRPLVMRILINQLLLPKFLRVLLTRVPTMLSHLYPLATNTDHHYCQAKA